MTLQEIADLMGMSRERVRQIEESALRNARKILRRKGYNPDNFFSDPRYTKPIKPTEGEILSDSTEYELMYEKEDKDE
jgi:transcriptional regulator with XRE-family HTH domain